jgi:1-aminocyclopropane-1-carboxylate deaminase
VSFLTEHTSPTAYNQLLHAVCAERNVRIDVKRIDLLHPLVNGNKWYKLKYNLERALASDHRTLVTFGGAWSNHIHATAAAGALSGVRTIGIIRGEEPKEYSNTLQFAKEKGMELQFVSRLDYEERNTEEFKAWLHDQYGSFQLVPEGGSNYYGVNGCMEILSESDLQNYTHVACACGTGATLAGMMLSAKNNLQFIGFSALKGGDFLHDEVIKHIEFKDQGNTFHFTEQVQLLGLGDFQELLKTHFNMLYTFGDYALTEFDSSTSPRLILIAQKR